MTNKTQEEIILELIKKTYYQAVDGLIEGMKDNVKKNPQLTSRELLNIVSDSIKERKRINGYDK